MKLNERQLKILEIIKENSPISGNEIAKKISISKSALRTDFSVLTNLKLISSKRNEGYSYVNKCTFNLVKEVMSPPYFISSKTSVYDAIVHLFTNDLGTLLICEDDNLVGIVSRKDFLRSAISGNIEKTPVSMIMTRMPNIIYCFENDSIRQATEKLITHEIDSIPVVRKENEKIKVIGRFTKTNTTKLYFELISNDSF